MRLLRCRIMKAYADARRSIVKAIDLWPQFILPLEVLHGRGGRRDERREVDRIVLENKVRGEFVVQQGGSGLPHHGACSVSAKGTANCALTDANGVTTFGP